MNGVSGHAAIIIITAIGHTLLTLQPPDLPIVRIPHGFNATVSLDILPHGNGLRYTVLNTTMYNGAIREVHGMIWPVDHAMVHGSMSITSNLVQRMNGE